MYAVEKTPILIVDDNASLCRTMSMVLERKGFEVASANDGFEAIEIVKNKPFDFIFMDIVLPVMDGLETYRRIKELRADTVVVMMTAYAVEDLVQDALQEGAYGVIYKPLDMDRVLDLIHDAIKSREGALILIVDDDEGTSTILDKLLTRKNYTVGVAHTGEEAIAPAAETSHDIMVIDLTLPTLNGLETYLAIREINHEAAAIMITGHRQEVAELVKDALRNGAYACLHKPLDMPVVLRLIAEILKNKKKPT